MTVTTKKKIIEPAKVMPYDPENKKLTKAEFIEKRRKEIERELKVKAFEADLKKKEKEEVKKEETKKEVKATK